MCLGACITISLTSTTNLPSRDTPRWTTDDILSTVGVPVRGVRLIHGEPDGPQTNSAFSSSILWRSMPVHDDDSSLATLAPATVDPISEPPPRSPSPTTHGPLGAHRQRRPDVLSKAKSRFNIFLNILQSSLIAMMFSPSYFLHVCSPNDFLNPRIVTLMLGCLQGWPYLRLLPTHAQASTLCVMGGRQRLLNDACSFYTCTGSALDVMDYGLARAEDSATH